MTYQDFAELVYSNYLKFDVRIILLSNNVDNNDVDIGMKRRFDFNSLRICLLAIFFQYCNCKRHVTIKHKRHDIIYFQYVFQTNVKVLKISYKILKISYNLYMLFNY